MFFFFFFLFSFTINAQNKQEILGHWENYLEVHTDTLTGTYTTKIDSKQVLIPNATVYINSSLIERLELDTNGNLSLSKILKDQSKIYQSNVLTGERSDITEFIPGFGEDQIISSHTGFFKVNYISESPQTLSIWLPDSTSQAIEQSQIILLTVFLQDDTLSTRDTEGTERKYIRVARISVNSEGQQEIIEGKKGIPGDLDADGDVDFTDFIIFSQNFGKIGEKPTEFIRTVIITKRDTIWVTTPTEK